MIRPDHLTGPFPPVQNSQDANIKYDQKGYTEAQLYPYAPAPDIIHCSADFRFRLQAPYFAYRSYSGTPIDQLEKTTAIRNPSQRMLWIEENDPRSVTCNNYTCGENLGTWEFYKDPDMTKKDLGNLTWWDTPAAFHTGSGTFSFADGHAESHRWIDNATLAIARYQAGWAEGTGERSRANIAQEISTTSSPTEIGRTFRTDGRGSPRDLPWVASRYATSTWP